MEKIDQYGKHNWAYYKSQIDLVEFAQWRGYIINPQKTSRNYVVLKKEGDVIVVYQNQNTGYQAFFNPIDSKDGGSVLNFEYNRSQKNWRSVFAALDEFLNELQKGLPRKNKSVLRPVPPPEAEYDPEYDFKLLKMQDFSYLNQRGISTATILSNYFQDQIFNKTFTYNGVRYVNTAFPLRNQTGVVAAIIRNAHYNKIERARGDACWTSNFDIIEHHVVTMVITESPIDALSFHELHGPIAHERRLYVATAGNLSQTQPQYIQYLIELYRPACILLANDNDNAGLIQNVRLMGILEHPSSTSQLKVKIQLLGQKVMFSFRFDAEQEASDTERIEKMIERYFKTTKKFIAPTKEGWVDVHMDNITAHFEVLEKLLLEEKTPRDWLKVHKPHLKDFNEDLQQKRAKEATTLPYMSF